MNDLGGGPRRQELGEVRKEGEPKSCHMALVSAVGKLDSVWLGTTEELCGTYHRMSPRGNIAQRLHAPWVRVLQGVNRLCLEALSACGLSFLESSVVEDRESVLVWGNSQGQDLFATAAVSQGG